MIILGFYLIKVRLRDLFVSARLYIVSADASACRSGSDGAHLPAVSLCPRRDHADYAIAAATPVASSTAIFAQKFDQDYRQAVSYVCLSTILSVATLPLVMLVAERFLS